MKSKLLFTLSALMLAVFAFGGSVTGEHDHYAKTFVRNTKFVPNEAWQEQLRNGAAWQQFVKTNGNWWVQFDESSTMPHRSFGPAINVGGSTPQNAAGIFIANNLKAFNLSNIDKVETGAPRSKKYFHVNYKQQYLGLDVLFSRINVTMTHDYKVCMFGLDVYNDINISTTAGLSAPDAVAKATADFAGKNAFITVQPQLRILPVADYRKYNYHLVYDLNVRFSDEQGVPSEYYTIIDANTGDILYRHNQVAHHTPPTAGGTTINVTGTIYPTHPYNPTAVVPLQYIKVNSGVINYTDVNGVITLPTATPTATLSLEGLYGKVYTGQNGTTVNSMSPGLSPGLNVISFDSDPLSTTHHKSAYYHTNVVHDFMKTYFPAFVAMDFPLTIRVDRTDGTCNAFFDGSSINFYTTAGGCNALSIVADVVYHEYGHGISSYFWSANGSSFQNGAMGEGYSDVWGISITNNPVLGIGFDVTDPAVYVRNYDFLNGVPRKVYPQNISGEVHNDGEIICGAWVDLAYNLNSYPNMTALYTESMFGLATGPDGQEGQVYTDILIDAMMADDNDANLLNGTPNIFAIADAFAKHGITLLTTSTLSHTPVSTSLPNTAITLNATVNNINPNFAWAFAGVKAFYALNNSTSWTMVSMTNTGGNNYSVSIPGQPNGTIVKYYIAMEDNNGAFANVKPVGANASDPNIPYYVMVGYNLLFQDDFDVSQNWIWATGVPGDNATTGLWLFDIPTQSLIGGVPVQPGIQNTPGGFICAVTGNANPNDGAGTQDIDNGKTTLVAENIDLSPYLNPAIEYYRWYTNDQGATPGTDFWQVSISNDGVNYVPVENTKVADHSWRRFAFRVSDYVTPTATVFVRFIAEDANAGSLVEALVDDFSIYEQAAVGIDENSANVIAHIYPNPSNDQFTVNAMIAGNDEVEVEIQNVTGQVVYKMLKTTVEQRLNCTIDVSRLPDGIYMLKLANDKNQVTRKISVSH